MTVVDAKEYFEYTPGILRAFMDPERHDAITFSLQEVLEHKMGVKFICGEVLELDGGRKIASIKCIAGGPLEFEFDYCIICTGCNYNPIKPLGESLWCPTVHEAAIAVSDWKNLDERRLEGRRQHVVEEHRKLSNLNNRSAAILIVGAGFIGVEWAAELNHFFPNLNITIIDFFPNCLGPLPASAAEYCSGYMKRHGIREVYGKKYSPNSTTFWESIGMPGGADETYICTGVRACNYFMPKSTLSDTGPGGGGWILINRKLQVTKKPSEGGEVWADGTVYAVGDCNLGCVGKGPNFDLAPVPKISYAGEEQARHACLNVIRMASCEEPGRRDCKLLLNTWWPWGAGMFDISLGPNDACFVVGANEIKGSGWVASKGRLAAFHKMMIETTKVAECKHGCIGILLWYFVHHMPINLWGRGPWCV